MAVTPNTEVVGLNTPDMSREGWIASLAGTPAAVDASESYDRVWNVRVSHAFARSIFRHESSDGTEGICADYNTKSPGNTRSSRTGKGTVLQVPGRGPFVRYETWADGWYDLAYRLVDDEFVYAQEGRTTIAEIIPRWAPASDNNVPTSYINAVVIHMNRWRENGVTPMSAQIPGFLWVPARSDHYDKGRTEKIRGGAQHYTAGVNSLDYLTWSSGIDNPKKRVSATFLVKHNPTLHDRGWQLVRIEDTPWTTAFANDYTVSIEYEHMGGPVSHEAYIVLAQTWIEIAAYVKDHNLGEIKLDRSGIKGHKEWVGNPSLTCPDGIDVDTLVGVIRDLQQTPQDPVGAPQITTTVPEPGGEANPWNTGYWLPIEFSQYIERHGFMTVGYAVSEAFAEDGLIVQYFERARLEIHPGQVVMAGLVGVEALWARHPNRRPPVRA